MTVQPSILHFEHYIAGQEQAAKAIKNLVSIDSDIAKCAFDLSEPDIRAFRTNTLENIKVSAKKNTQLFRLVSPTPEEYTLHIEAQPILSKNFVSSRVKSCISSYSRAQRTCLLCIKSIFDDNPHVAGALFNLDDLTSQFLQKRSTFELADIADRCTWLLNLSSNQNESFLQATIERISFDRTFVESSLLY